MSEDTSRPPRPSRPPATTAEKLWVPLLLLFIAGGIEMRISVARMEATLQALEKNTEQRVARVERALGL